MAIPDLRTKWALRGVFPPAGYIFLPDWARALGRNPNTARVHLQKGDIPQAIRVGRTRRYTGVPEGLPWTAEEGGVMASLFLPIGHPQQSTLCQHSQSVMEF